MPISSTHCLPFQTAAGMSSRFSISSCHCQIRGFGARTSTGLLPASAINSAAIASCKVSPSPDLVGQHEAGAVGSQVGIEGQLDEVFLVLPESDFLAEYGRFDDRSGGVRLFPPTVDAVEDFTA